jgi:ribonuclease PH
VAESNRLPASRRDGRAHDALRAVSIEPGFVRSADGSALIAMGGTRGGWLTAEYGMLPASTGSRRQRDVSRGRPDGRTVEIQRLIGRSLRSVVDIDSMGPRTLYIDCDVLEADGGTRCASITGAFVAVRLAFGRLVERGDLERPPLTDSVAAVSCGLVGGAPRLDLDYPEDSTAEVDMNVVMTGSGELVEVQATAEGVPFSRASLDELLGLAAKGIVELRDAQDAAVTGPA